MTADGAISIDQGVVTLNKAGVLAASIVKPTALTDDYKLITITSLSAQLHTLVITGGTFGNGGAGFTTATFGAAAGNSITLLAYNGQWYVVGNRGVTFA
jgi:hypothetical protein